MVVGIEGEKVLLDRQFLVQRVAEGVVAMLLVG